MEFEMFVETHGNGDPLLLVPGFASGAWCWFAQIPELSRERQLIAFDPRGIGRSQSGASVPTMESFVSDAISVLDELGIESADVLGASFGGFVAQELAMRFPSRVRKLILACTTAGGPTHVGPSPEILASFAPDPTVTVGERIRKFIRPAFSDDFNTEHADVVERICRLREENEVSEAVYLAQLQAAVLFDSNPRLSSIGCPTLVVTGDRDRVVPMENSRNLAGKIPGAKLSIIHGGSHMLFVERAADFNRSVAQFLKQ